MRGRYVSRGSPGVCIHVIAPPFAGTTPTRQAELLVPALGYCTGTVRA